MPTIQQLVRKGRKKLKTKSKSPIDELFKENQVDWEAHIMYF